MDTAHEALKSAIDKAGGQVALARAIGKKQSNIWDWLNKSKRGAPAGYVIAIEMVTGVSRHDLRPDIYPREPVSLGHAALHTEGARA